MSARRPRALLSLALAPLLLGAAKPVLVPDISSRSIEIRYSFTGAQLLLFGAILYPRGILDESPTVLGLRTFQLFETDDFDVVVPMRSVVERIVRAEDHVVLNGWAVAHVRGILEVSVYALVSLSAAREIPFAVVAAKETLRCAGVG